MNIKLTLNICQEHSKAVATVAVVRTGPGSAVRDFGRAMELAGYRRHLRKSRDTILKLNLSWTKYYPACSTSPWQLEGVIQKLLSDGYRNILPVENRTVVTDPVEGALQNRWTGILDRHCLKYTPLTRVKWVRFKPRRNLLALDKVFPDGHRVPKMFMGRNIVHLPTMKTHGHTTTTGAVKNAFGGLITERRHHCHKHIHDVLADLVAIQKELHPGIFSVMDATVCGTGRGPRTMKPVAANRILAGADPVALDAVAARIMGFDPMRIGYIRKCHDLGLGCGNTDEIDIAGEDIRSLRLRFRTGRSPVIFWDQVLRGSALFERVIFRSRLFRLCVFASAFYHDRLWYQTVGRARIGRFMKTPWGRLFQSYENRRGR